VNRATHRRACIVLACAAACAAAQCGGAVSEERASASWTAAGVPPVYVERRWRADVPASLRKEFESEVAQTRFFDLPADLGANPSEGRDMGSYSITISLGGRTHTVNFSDATQTQPLSSLRRWLVDRLGPTASVE